MGKNTAKIKIYLDKSIVLVRCQPEDNVYFSAKYLGRKIMADPDLGDEKFNYYKVQRLDDDKILYLHPIWYEVYFRG